MKSLISFVYKTIQASNNSVYGNKQRIAAIVSDSITDIKIKKLLLISTREEIPKKLFTIFSNGISSNSLEVSTLKTHFKDDTFLENEAVETIFDFWVRVIWWDDFYLLIPMRDESQKWGFCNESEDMVIPFQFDYAKPFSQGLSVILINDKYGYINKKGEIVIPAVYNNADSFKDGIARVEIDRNIWAYIDLKGINVIGPYNVTDNYDKGLNMLSNRFVRSYNKDLDKYGFINDSNIKEIDYIFDQVSNFSENFALLGTTSNPEGYINKKGQIVKRITYEEAYNFSNGRALIKSNEKYGFLDEKFSLVISPIYEKARPFSNGFAAVKQNNLWGFIDINGKKIIENKYLDAEDFSEERAFVLKNSGWGFIDCFGKEYTNFDYFNYKSLGWETEDYGFDNPDMHIFKDGLAIISRIEDSKDLTLWLNGQKESKFGCIDIYGNEVIECKYPPIDGHFQNDLAKIGYTYHGGWSYSFYGYIDKFGNTYGFKISNDNDDYYPFSEYDFMDFEED